jgi:adenosylmethionine-8-amino-7-oxononanoate aminotransferase
MVGSHALAALDKEFIWHPFTQMSDWLSSEHEPLILVSGEGAWLRDAEGRIYLDGNSSIWTNVHGHKHPVLSQAIREQLERVAHTSFLGQGNSAAAELARELVNLVKESPLRRVFFSDNGSTAIEVAIKMAAQYFQQNGRPEKQGFIAFSNAYHGDTLGASSLGGIKLFHERFAVWQFPVHRVAAVAELDGLDGREFAGLVIEPLIQGAAGMKPWPPGMLRPLRKWCDRHEVFLIFDEVMTGFGRTGTMFAFEQEDVSPDFLALAKGLTGGYLPLGATLTTERVFAGFLGEQERTFFYGHSYSGNQLGCAAALANLAIFAQEETLKNLEPKILILRDELARLSGHRNVRSIRRCGFIAGIELGQADGSLFPANRRTGAMVCQEARKHQFLSRPIGDVVVLMLPLCVTAAEITFAVDALGVSIDEACRE